MLAESPLIKINLPPQQEIADKDWPQTDQKTCDRLPTHID